MYVHLGGEVVVPVLEIVAVLDVRLVWSSEINRELVDRAAAEKRLQGGGLNSDCKAIVITTLGSIYTSGISVPTLTKRMTHLQQSAKAWEAET